MCARKNDTVTCGNHVRIMVKGKIMTLSGTSSEIGYNHDFFMTIFMLVLKKPFSFMTSGNPDYAHITLASKGSIRIT